MLLDLSPQDSETSAEVEVPVTDGPPPPQTEGSPFGNFLVPTLLIIAVFWFLLIAPERKQRKQREEMLDALKKGDKVMTTGGIYGSVVQVKEDLVTLQIADGVRGEIRPGRDPGTGRRGPAGQGQEGRELPGGGERRGQVGPAGPGRRARP